MKTYMVIFKGFMAFRLPLYKIIIKSHLILADPSFPGSATVTVFRSWANIYAYRTGF